MKNNSAESRLHSISPDPGQESWKNLQKIKSSSKTSNPTMTEQLIAPPARVWDKIEKILDEQDNRQESANKIIASCLGNKPDYNRTKFCVASVACLGLIAVLIWMMR
jgi:hypothetical protein